MEEVFKALRSELGISNRGVRQGDFARLILREGRLFVVMANKNPDMTLADLAELERN
jgi:exopolyphosphatase/pppGpp-phosphohydrolase